MAGMLTVTVNPALDTAVTVGRVEANRKLRCSAPQHDPGGGGLNVARAVHQLGGEAIAVWAGGGIFGGYIESLLRREGIDQRRVAIDGETRQSFAVIEEGDGRHFRFSTPGPALEAEDLDEILSSAVGAEPDLAVISGGLPPGVPVDYYARLAAALAARKARVIVDTHGEPLRIALESGAVFLVKPNYRELVEMAGSSGGERPAVPAAARRLLEGGVAAVLVSLGAGGATLVTAEGEEHFATPAVPIRSRIGAGDSMVGALAWRLLCGDDLSRAARYGTAAGTAAVMSPGTGLCRREDVESIFSEIRATKGARPESSSTEQEGGAR